jgi:hypothetical protein
VIATLLALAMVVAISLAWLLYEAHVAPLVDDDEVPL